MPVLPNSAARYELAPSQYRAAMDVLLPVAAHVGYHFSADDISSAAHAADIAATHELFSNTKELYHEALRYAHSRIWPTWSQEDSDELERMIPGDAIRRFSLATFERFREFPDAVRLIVAENMFQRATITTTVGILEDSPVVLVIDRLLMRGHDVGAFRTGVSAEDLFVLLTSLCAFPITQGPIFHALYGMDISDAQNTEGMGKMISDATVTFLSTTMATTQGSSYTHSSHSPSLGSSVAASLYSSQEYPSEDDFNLS
ncbi:hypothetical protein GC425_06840 [Corynebacterium sp. zg254]|uniref:HTH-type transcriptional repressor NicS C-terminal domain-containing protein n=2 Tax=Corynebacteriaceae TaxID=1653 RepID=A0ABQ6VDE8_9CORY|nr:MULTISPECIES: hypothetical protein [Corynebacterium]KAB1551408.1 hypothetical protein F7233_07820 [Corynebacterium sp. 321]KAB3520950.1 hypothetical protein F8377_06860 [Corynebacterium zhongnanshanii]MCR5914581.1 hypothetical protein [Corynebacterium sp. zg254]